MTHARNHVPLCVFGYYMYPASRHFLTLTLNGEKAVTLASGGGPVSSTSSFLYASTAFICSRYMTPRKASALAAAGCSRHPFVRSGEQSPPLCIVHHQLPICLFCFPRIYIPCSSETQLPRHPGMSVYILHCGVPIGEWGWRPPDTNVAPMWVRFARRVYVVFAEGHRHVIALGWFCCAVP
jgi:hypothetical protein